MDVEPLKPRRQYAVVLQVCAARLSLGGGRERADFKPQTWGWWCSFGSGPVPSRTPLLCCGHHSTTLSAPHCSAGRERQRHAELQRQRPPPHRPAHTLATPAPSGASSRTQPLVWCHGGRWGGRQRHRPCRYWRAGPRWHAHRRRRHCCLAAGACAPVRAQAPARHARCARCALRCRKERRPQRQRQRQQQPLRRRLTSARLSGRPRRGHARGPAAAQQAAAEVTRSLPRGWRRCLLCCRRRLTHPTPAACAPLRCAACPVPSRGRNENP